MSQQSRPTVGMDTPEDVSRWLRAQQRGGRSVGWVELGFLLVASGPVMVAMGEPGPGDEDHVAMLRMWWGFMDSLPVEIAKVVNDQVCEYCGFMPPRDWTARD